ncbi:MAG: Sir2 family NAD-dependent protein deacetylase [Anaerolineales bacterium]|nr:Sir2 family NAD-dependent protein deacetylase [Anaerolineales bacterium]
MVFPSSEKISQLDLASQLILDAEYCVALTGAGISTPSGIPDFRSPGSGVWTRYSPMEVASLSAFRYNPDRFYDWLRPFLKSLFQADPNPAHMTLAALEDKNYLQAIITQNIDCLHQRAGSNCVIEVHGTYQTLTCLGCFQQVEADFELISTFLADSVTPHCPECGSLLKPDIILYEEQLPADKWKQAKDEITKCDLLLVLGSSLTVTPVCDLPYSALGNGAKLIIINRICTHLADQAAVSIQGDLEELLPIIENKVLNEKK